MGQGLYRGGEERLYRSRGRRGGWARDYAEEGGGGGEEEEGREEDGNILNGNAN